MLDIRTVTIIGANGTMGRNIAAIFASFGNASVYLVSRTLEKSIQAKGRAYQSVRAESVKERMEPRDYSQLEECVEKSDLIFEACAESWEVKQGIHQMVSAALENMPKKIAQDKIVCSGTSGLSITSIAELYSEEIRPHVIGMHFFNPPYQMTLCELTATSYTDRERFSEIFDYTKRVLYRTTVEVKDSPAFLGNRIGFQFINEAMQLAEKYKYNGGIDYIDAILGPFTGRAMAPLVTANFVGLDVHKAIVDNLYENTEDFSHQSFVFPEYAEELVRNGRLGRKAGAGLYKTVLHDSGVKLHQVYDIENGYYRETMSYKFPFVEQMISFLQDGDYKDAVRVLENNFSAEAEVCLQELLRYILYSLHAAEAVGYQIHAADDVMAAGFNWCPPLALIEALGGKETVKALCRERIDTFWLSQDKQEHLLEQAEPSRYDFRRFIRAKW